MSDFNNQISKLVNDFIAEVTALARKAAIDTLQASLGGAAAAPRVVGRRAATVERIAVPTISSGRRPKGAKRPAGEIEKTKARVLSHIQSNPGQRVEQINKALGTSTKDLTLPLQKLINDGEVRTEGVKRATTYFPGDGKPSDAGGGKKKRRKKS
ncbi:MAG: DNA-binding protein [Deltaproteobacteria bacterium]|nr:DNA-binding protein [Deltaproteobacteria bacterium]